MNFKIAVLAVAFLACQGNAQILGGFMRPLISGYATGISEMAKPFIQLGQSVVSPATDYIGSMKSGMTQYLSYPTKPLAMAQNAVQEAQAAAQLAAQQAQLVAQTAVEQAQSAARQAQAAVYDGFQSVSSVVPGVTGSSTVQVIRPRPIGPQSAIQEAQAVAQAAANQAQAAAKQAQAAALQGFQTVTSVVPGVPGVSSMQVIPSSFGPQSAIQEAQAVAQAAANQAQAAAKQAQNAALQGFQTVTSVVPGVPGVSSMQVIPGSFGPQSIIDEAQAVAHAAVKQAQAAAQFAAQQAQLAAKTVIDQAQAHTLGKLQTVSSFMPEFPGSNAVQVSRPRPTVSQITEVGQAIRPRPYPLPMPSAETASEIKESVESHVPASLLPEVSGEMSAQGKVKANGVEAKGNVEVQAQQ